MNLEDALSNRWRADWDVYPAMAHLRSQVERVTGIVKKLRERDADLRANPRLTPFGRAEELRSFVGKDLAPEMVRATASIAHFRARIAARRDTAVKAATSPIDKADVANAVLRADMRVMLRGPRMTMHQRAEMLLRETADPTLVTAVLEAPNEMSGIDQQLRDILVERMIERAHPQFNHAMNAALDGLQLLEVATESARGVIGSACNLPSKEAFDALIGSAVDQGRAARIAVGVGQEFASFDVAA